MVTEALSTGNVIATAKRHGIQAQQIYRWRERLEERQGQTAFLPVSVSPDSVLPGPTPVPDQGGQDHSPAAMLDCSPRVEIVLSAGRRVIAGPWSEVLPTFSAHRPPAILLAIFR